MSVNIHYSADPMSLNIHYSADPMSVNIHYSADSMSEYSLLCRSHECEYSLLCRSHECEYSLLCRSHEFEYSLLCRSHEWIFITLQIPWVWIFITLQIPWVWIFITPYLGGACVVELDTLWRQQPLRTRVSMWHMYSFLSPWVIISYHWPWRHPTRPCTPRCGGQPYCPSPQDPVLFHFTCTIVRCSGFIHEHWLSQLIEIVYACFMTSWTITCVVTCDAPHLPAGGAYVVKSILYFLN